MAKCIDMLRQDDAGDSLIANIDKQAFMKQAIVLRRCSTGKKTISAYDEQLLARCLEFWV